MTMWNMRPAWRPRTFATAPVAGLLLWGCLWLNLNTGFWNLEQPRSPEEWILAIRAALALAVLPFALLIIVCHWEKLRLPGLGPSRLLMIYGVVAAMSSWFSPEPWSSFYWGAAFIATIAVVWTFACTRRPVATTWQLLQINWLITALVAGIIAYTGRDLIFGDAPTAYGIIGELAGATRSSGVARWAAVPGIVCLLKAFHARRPAWMAVHLSTTVIAFFIVYRVQSRGALFGALGALAFGFIEAKRLRKYALPLIVFAALVLMLHPRVSVSSQVSEYIRRGQTAEQFKSMTGRTRAYESGLEAFREAPVLGRGNWTDRLVIHEHVHNSFLQALLNAGVVGFIPYLGSWISGWVLFFRLFRKRHRLLDQDRTALMEAGAVMMFFAVRAIPETTTASYAVDLLIMAAVYAYLESLTVATEKEPVAAIAASRVRAHRFAACGTVPVITQ